MTVSVPKVFNFCILLIVTKSILFVLPKLLCDGAFIITQIKNVQSYMWDHDLSVFGNFPVICLGECQSDLNQLFRYPTNLSSVSDSYKTQHCNIY